MKLHAPICLFLLVGSPFSPGQTGGTKIAPNGETSISSIARKTTATVSFTTVAVPVSSAGGQTPSYPQCTGSRVPCSLTERIRITVDGSDVFVPRSAWADLGDISYADLISSHGSFVIVIRGGDASESYVVRLSFNRRGVLVRRIFSGEDPRHLLEITRYFQPSTSN
jgi:hypothetical protein